MVQKTWRLIWLTFVVVALLALAAGCGTPKPAATQESADVEATTPAAVVQVANAYPLAATAWDLDYFGPPEQRVPKLPDTRATVVFFWDRYAGFDGCNWFLGVYSATTEGELRMMTPARTYNPSCGPDELSDQMALYTTSMLNVIEYRLEGEQLIANAVNDQRLLTYNPATPVQMLGTEWKLGFWWHADSSQWLAVIPASMTTITFDEGKASGSGGCSNYTVSYEGDLQIEKVMEATDTYAELPTLTFGPVDVQFASCTEPEGIMDQEQGFFTTLGSVAYYFKLGGMLMMLDTEGTPVLIFAAPN